jgi:hypothetical protein
MSEAGKDLVMMFTGGTDTTLAADKIAEAGEYRRIHLLTFCNGICVRVERSRVHAEELVRKHGADLITHEIIYVTELFKRVRSPLKSMIKEYDSTLTFDLCCRLSMESRAIMYALDHDITEICDGTNIDQGRLFLERPEYMRVSKAFFASFGIRYFSPVYAKAGGRLGRRDDLIRRGFTVGPSFFEKLNISSCLSTQPFCLMAFHTFFFTSFMRKVPLLRGFISKHNLPLDRAIELRLEREKTARAAIEEHVAFNSAEELPGTVRIQDRFCTTRLCGRNAVEFAFPKGTRLDVEALAIAWAAEGTVTADGNLVRLKQGRVELEAYSTGRVLISGAGDAAAATEVFERLVAVHDVFARPATCETG